MTSTIWKPEGRRSDAVEICTARNDLVQNIMVPKLHLDKSLKPFMLSDSGRATLINVPPDVKVTDEDGNTLHDFGGGSLHIDSKTSVIFVNRSGKRVLDVDFSPSR